MQMSLLTTSAGGLHGQHELLHCGGEVRGSADEAHETLGPGPGRRDECRVDTMHPGYGAAEHHLVGSVRHCPLASVRHRSQGRESQQFSRGSPGPEWPELLRYCSDLDLAVRLAQDIPLAPHVGTREYWVPKVRDQRCTFDSFVVQQGSLVFYFHLSGLLSRSSILSRTLVLVPGHFFQHFLLGGARQVERFEASDFTGLPRAISLPGWWPPSFSASPGILGVPLHPERLVEKRSLRTVVQAVHVEAPCGGGASTLRVGVG